MAQVIQTKLGQVEFEIAGSGPPLIVFHGSPGGWDGALLCAEQHLPEGFQIIGFSRPGYLGTPLTNNGSAEQQAGLAAALLDELSIPSAAVYGLSGGGPYALAFAINHPERCSGLILGATVTKRDPRPDWQLHCETALLHLLDWLVWIPGYLAPGWKWSRILRVIAPFSRRASGYRNDVQVFNQLPPFALGKISCPVLMVHDREDRNASFAHARETALRIPDCHKVFVEGCGHIDVFDRPWFAKRSAASYSDKF